MIIFFLVQVILHNEDKAQISNPLPPQFCSTFKPPSQQAQGVTQECKALPSGSRVVRLVMLFHTMTPSKDTKAFTESCHCFLLQMTIPASCQQRQFTDQATQNTWILTHLLLTQPKLTSNVSTLQIHSRLSSKVTKSPLYHQQISSMTIAMVNIISV